MNDLSQVPVSRGEYTEEELHQLTLKLSKLPYEELHTIRDIIGVAKHEDIDVSALDPATIYRIELYMRHSVISWKNLRFVVMDCPKDAAMDSYMQICMHYKVKNVVCLTQLQYSKKKFEDEDITINVWDFQDGSPPPADVKKKWIKLVKDTFGPEAVDKSPTASLGVHCAAGLGRAPVLVAVALLEFGMDVYEAVELIRSKRRGAINQKQLQYLIKYEPQSDSSCTIS
mmetsp:Transcript_29826/g.83333  ORF Transcript_29826/g.83333 Transcript_29826/m.83333 type:complete len:228 (+) Transcript_29826:99-782(+)|eukprot:CAMPEP_0119132828 /NCGR_PEP_ID=MMETSP1310-20130426/12402_1 /TAXON_ID=464262 /ORGANISM="Genus nov. species nov., Strain RCC2339" /LENGTH=227 /DNA_ID=CAMNT_0007123489 /DNA_START=97 /DNA_END=780 /DNA_ORIENTATION=+